MVRNERKKKAAAILCIIAIVFIFVGCKKETPTPESGEETATSLKKESTPTTRESEIAESTSEGIAVGSNEAMLIELGVGVGHVRFGMSKEEVIKHLGQPDKMEDLGYGAERMDYIASRGLNFGLDTTTGVNYIKCYSKEYPDYSHVATFVGRTKRGVVMGASRNQIITVYGEPDRTASKEPFTILYYDSLRSEMITTNGRLVGIKMVSQL